MRKELQDGHGNKVYIVYKRVPPQLYMGAVRLLVPQALTPYFADSHATLYQGDARVVLAALESDSVDCGVTSPPYWALRAYMGIEPLLFGGDPKCVHGEMTTLAEPGNTYREDKGNIASAYQDARARERYSGKTRWQHVAQEAQDKGIPVRDVEPGAWETVPIAPTKMMTKGLTETAKWPAGVDAMGGPAVPSAACRLCGAWRGNLGQEPTPDMYIAHLMEYMDALWRVLKPTGTVWVNIDDSRVGSSAGNNEAGTGIQNGRNRPGVEHPRLYTARSSRLRPTSLALIPDRFAIACQEHGWIVESKIIWDKNNPMPESAKRRPSDAHEYIFLLAKSPKWRFYQDAVREPLAPPGPSNARASYDGVMPSERRGETAAQPKYGVHPNIMGAHPYGYPIGGRNIRTVWRFPTQGSNTPHPATYPEELVERCLLAGTQEGDIVLDPFAGSGTTLWVAKRLGRRAIGVELSLEYCDIAMDRIRQQVLL